jgi:hypothetical protein
MITIREYAQQNNISLKMARHRLESQVKHGTMIKKRGREYMYFETTPMTIRWHDPFNLIERRTA